MGTHPATTYGPETPMVAEDVANGLPYGVTGNAPHWCGGCGFESRWGSDSKRGLLKEITRTPLIRTAHQPT